MKEETENITKETFTNKKFYIILSGNIFLGLLIFLFLTTNLEWNNKIANILFPFIVFAFSFFTIKYAKSHFEKPQKHKIIWSSILSFLVSGLYFLYYILCITVGFLFFLFSMSEEHNKVLIQRASSPNNVRYCETYFYPVGAYSGGTGRIRIYCINKFFPLVRKEVYYEPTAHFAYEEEELPFNFVSWKDNKKILIYQTKEISVCEVVFYVKKLFLMILRNNTAKRIEEI